MTSLAYQEFEERCFQIFITWLARNISNAPIIIVKLDCGMVKIKFAVVFCEDESQLPDENIFFLTEVIEFWNLGNTGYYCMLANLKIYPLFQFLSNRPETFRICSRGHFKGLQFADFRIRPLNWNYWILKILCKVSSR